MKKNLLFFVFLIHVNSFTFSQIITTFAGGGLGVGDSAIKVGMQPNGVTLDTLTRILYISDGINNAIRSINVSTDIVGNSAGNGTPGYTGNGGPAAAAQLNNAQGVCLDKSGNLYEADYANNAIRIVNTSGIISTFAGIGVAGYSGDGGPATAAELRGPNEVESDSKGNIYISEYFNQRIRKVNTSGIITTIAGNGVRGFSGNGGPATAAELFNPDGVCADTAGNIYISDEDGENIRKVDTSGIIHAFAGTNSGGFSGDGGPATAAEIFSPSTVFADVHGNVFFGDQNNNRIRMINTSGIITTVAGNGAHGFSGDGGPATAAEIYFPQGIYVDNLGNMYIADYGNYRTRMVNTSGIISTIAGNGSLGYYGNGVPATNAELLLPEGISIDKSGNMYIADNVNYRVHTINTSGIIYTIAGNGYDGFSGDGGQATAAELDYPTGVTTDLSGNVYISDEYNQRVRSVNSSGIIITFAGDTTVGGFSGDGGPATAAELYYPIGLDFDSVTGSVYIADAGNNRIRIVNSSGIISTIAGISIGGYSGDGGPATAAELAFPAGVIIDSVGNIYIADESNNVVRKINTSGIISTIAGNGTSGYSGDSGPATAAELYYPYSLAIDKSGDIFIADNLNTVIRKVDPTGVITTYAGDAVKGFSGDGGFADIAELHGPNGITIDTAGNLYVVDNFNNRIRKITPPDITTGLNKSGRSIISPEVNVYPVPGNGLVYVSLNGNGYTGLKIYDVFSNEIYSLVLDAAQQNKGVSINIMGVSNGVYFMQVKNRNRVINKRIVIEK